MFGGRSRDDGGGRASIDRVPLKGLFADGTWKCNCDPRLPAEHFQTKNGGKNHGRWFYTCQKSQPKRCNFFLWDDEAKPREAGAILKNSRTEMQTATKPTITNADGPEPITPHTPSKPLSVARPSIQGMEGLKEEEFYEWPDSENEGLAKVADRVSMPPPDTPRKAGKTEALSTPGKRRLEEAAWSTPSTDTEDVFATPSTGFKGRGLFSTAGLPSPEDTPTPKRYRDIPVGNADLTTEVLISLKDCRVELSTEAITSLKEICSRHMLKTQGIARGRDISRMAIKTKDAKITELHGRISALEAERDTNRAVIRHLRRDMELARNKA